MLKRVVVIAAVGIATCFALPTIALGQEEQGGEETTSTASTPVTEVEPVTEVTAALSEETTVEEESTEESSDEIEPQTAPADTSSSSSASTASNSSASTQSSLTTATKSSGKKRKKGRKSGKKSCSASSSGGGPQAQASAPPAAGCVRLEGGNGPLVLPDGTTLNITETSQGVIEFTVSGGPTGTFSGTIFVKGGPDSPGFACVFNGVTAGSCHTPVNPNNNKFYGVSHVDACPGTFTEPGEPERDRDRSEGDERDKKVAGGRKQVSNVAAGETVTPQGEQLPFTGLPVAWLLIVGGALISGGLAIRRKP